MTQPQVQTELTEQGYTKVHDLEFDDGMWKAEAKSANGNRVEVRIDAKTDQVYPEDQVSSLSDRDVRAYLRAGLPAVDVWGPGQAGAGLDKPARQRLQVHAAERRNRAFRLDKRTLR